MMEGWKCKRGRRRCAIGDHQCEKLVGKMSDESDRKTYRRKALLDGSS